MTTELLETPEGTVKLKVYPQSKPLAKTIQFAENFAAIQDMDELKSLVDKLYKDNKIIGFDIETGYTGADVENRATNMYHPSQFIAGFSLTNDPQWARYVPLRHDHSVNLNPNEVWELMKPLLEEKPVVSHNAIFEVLNLLLLDTKGDGPSIDLRKGVIHDSMLQAYVLSDIPPMTISGALEEGRLVQRYLPKWVQTEDGWHDPKQKSFGVGLKSLTKFRYNYDQAEIHTLFSREKPLTAKQKRQIRFNALPIDHKVIHYACDDAYLCLQLHFDQMEAINKDPYLPRVYELERNILDLLVDMNMVGMSVDWEGISTNAQVYKSFLHEMKVLTRTKFEEEIGHQLPDLNLQSPKQIGSLLYSKPEDGGLGYNTTRTTDSGTKSTDDKAVVHLKNTSPGVDALLKYRKCKKTGEWVENWYKLQGEYADGKLHPNFIQVRVPSGRFASSGPNVQNIGKRWWYQTKEGPAASLLAKGTANVDYWTSNARDFIRASDGYTLLAFDYASAEIQFVAALAQEGSIIEAFHRGENFHKWAASLMYGIPVDEVTPKQRQSAKAFSFGNIYQQSIKELAQQLDISVKEAEELHDKYFSRFPNLDDWFEQQKRIEAEYHEVRTWLGRRVTLWEGMHPERVVRSKGARLSINAAVQGGATGDYPKYAMIRVARYLKKKGWWGSKVRMLMNQHDSLVFEVHDSIDIPSLVEDMTPLVQFSLEGIEGYYNEFPSFPPMSVDWEVGYTYGSLMPLENLDILRASELLVSTSKLHKEDIGHLQAVSSLYPGNVPLVLNIEGQRYPTKFRVKAHPDVMSAIEYGNPDMDIDFDPQGRLHAQFHS